MNLELLSKLDALRLAFEHVDVTLPLSLADDDVGTIVDANGRDVLTIDVNRERDDDDVNAIAELIVCLVNNSAGFLPGVSYSADRAERKVA